MDQLQSTVIEPLKPYLLPITSNLPKPVNDAIITLLGSPCHSALLLDLDITKDPQCLSLAISKAVGFGIVGASSIVKIPQILKLLNSQSSAGVSFLSYALETASFLISLAYNVRQGFPFSTFGEQALIAMQDVVVGVLVLQFAGKAPAAGAFVAVVAASVYALFSESLVDQNMIGYLQAGAAALGMASKAPQIFTIWKQGGTGQLSAFAVFNFLLGSLARVFTTLQEVDDKLILYGAIAGFVLNAILAVQMAYYWNSPATKAHAGEFGEKPAKMAHAGQTGSVKATGSSPSGSAKKGPTTRRRG